MRSLKVGEAVDLGIHEGDMLVGGMDGSEHMLAQYYLVNDPSPSSFSPDSLMIYYLP